MNKKKPTILVHLPAYRDPELIPTIKDALANAKYPKRIHFGICRQFCETDEFDNLQEFKKDKRVKVLDFHYKDAKGLPWARAQINENLLTDEDYILQLDSHHRFAKDWDETLIEMHSGLEAKGYKPILAAYLPLYTPFNDPEGRTMEPWQQHFVCFYPHGTIFIRPGLLTGWEDMTEPPMSRFLSGHFCFARSEWAREIKHDPDIYFSGEELNLTVRSYTHGYDMFHPHKLVVWHSTMREERSGMLKWDDDSKNGVDWFNKQEFARKKIRCLLRSEEDPTIDLTGYDLGTVRSIRDYEKYAGVNFKTKSVQKYTLDSHYPPNPLIENDELWEQSFMKSFYHLITIYTYNFPRKNYKHILVAFDDENGEGLNHRYITGNELNNFMNNGINIHYEEYFLTDKKPARVVYWGFTEEEGWVERVEENLN
jgi:glycosyltransferase involved in cell wall biosynthesis